MTKKILLILITVIFIVNCSVKKTALKIVANSMTSASGSNVFTSDNDPELVAAALPFTIKLYETLLVSLPKHRGLVLQTGSLYIMYANAFLQGPASILEEEKYQQREELFQRARNLYLRGRDIILNYLYQQYPQMKKNIEKRNFKEAAANLRKRDCQLAYWAAAGWLGAYALNPFDMEMGVMMPAAAEMMKRVEELDPTFNRGAIADFFIIYYGSLPDYLGGDSKRARDYFKKAVEISSGKLASPYVSLATTVSVKEQNLAEFKELLAAALKINVDDDPANRLVNVLQQRKARWYLEHSADFFVEEEEEEEK